MARNLKIYMKSTNGRRLDTALLEVIRKDFPQASRRQLKKLFQEDRVRIEEKPTSPSFVALRPVTVILERVDATFWSPQARPAPSPFLPVIFEDQELLVLNKESGTPSVPHTSDEENTAVHSALSSCPELAETFPGLEAGLVHRLDTGTSGVLVFAKTLKTYESLRKNWKTNHVQKTYLALTSQPVEPQMIHVPLVRIKGKHDRIGVADEHKLSLRGSPLPAKSEIERCTQLDSECFEVRVRIYTGVMHQIRVHLQSLGAPIIGDLLYGGRPGRRLWLHAHELEIRQKSGINQSFSAPPPWDPSDLSKL